LPYYVGLVAALMEDLITSELPLRDHFRPLSHTCPFPFASHHCSTSSRPSHTHTSPSTPKHLHDYMSPAASSLPAPYIGYCFLAASALLLVLGTHALLLGALYPNRHADGGRLGDGGGYSCSRDGQGQHIVSVVIRCCGCAVFDTLARDTHYKYLALFSVPVCAYFVIANWVGWQFFRNS